VEIGHAATAAAAAQVLAQFDRREVLAVPGDEVGGIGARATDYPTVSLCLVVRMELTQGRCSGRIRAKGDPEKLGDVL